VSDWLAAFPIRPACDAVEALCESWRFLAKQWRPGFHPGQKEPQLTRVLKAHVEVTSRDRGLFGMWAAEGLINAIDPDTAHIREERRSDIVYGWNNDHTGIQIVFEFKKVSRHRRTHNVYLGKNGLQRFVAGIYSRKQAIAVMAGVLLDPKELVVPPLCLALGQEPTSSVLRLRRTPSGEPFEKPSILFPAAEFDTEHDRDAHLAPSHGTIRVAHFFLGFDYRTAPGFHLSPQRAEECPDDTTGEPS
jgi:hypothetical protein